MNALLLGAVAYDPKVVTIWEGFRRWLGGRGFEFDFVLYSGYERQVEDLLAGRVDVAWNSPLAWVRARRLAAAAGVEVRAVAMRDTDRDLTTAVVVRSDAPLTSPADLRGRTVAVGAADSPQATLLPLSLLRSAGLEPGSDVKVRRHDVGVGLHGDHIGGEREAAIALRDGLADAACVTDANLLLFGREGTLVPGSTRVLAQTAPYDHCVMAAGPGADRASAERFAELLLGMSYADPEARPLLDLEGLTRWLPGRTSGYAALEAAVDESGFYDREGGVRAGDRRP
ncbi:phosphate/phosphite/phosphonate ABC transporter substrate-binding protein [Microtetraspora niveoalba]|uniref:phosphate/phosphite/phosphonate ABC transporter substrate-binding protein n=1 Tax=Microtetraspora niveoalba TaxID=46175 RepID=UPI00082A2209|nr:phosphate/phosphite/phosphonate ABC transporter substrate-binding protein [Microtetraspora niveoalba]